MANDRLIIRCQFCGKTQTMAKYYPTWFTGDTAEGGLCMYDDHATALQRFLGDHSTHHPRHGTMDLGGDPGFTLETE